MGTECLSRRRFVVVLVVVAAAAAVVADAAVDTAVDGGVAVGNAADRSDAEDLGCTAGVAIVLLIWPS